MDDGDLARMRERLYRPDPPPGLADRYLAARTAPVLPAEPAAPRAGARRRGVLLAVAVLAAAGAIVSARVLEPGTAHASLAAPAGVPRPEATAGPLPPVVPGVLLAERTSADVPGPLLLDAGGRVVTVALVCRIDGVITVSIGPETPLTFVCTASGPALAMVRSTGALGRFALRVAAGPHVQWAISVGADAHPDAGLGFAE